MKRGIELQKNNICKILDYWYMNDILNQDEHPYEDVKNYTILKQKAESTYKKTELEDYIDVAFAVTAEQLRSDVILKLIDDEVAKLNEIRFGEQLQLDEDEKKPKRYEINGKISLYIYRKTEFSIRKSDDFIRICTVTK